MTDKDTTTKPVTKLDVAIAMVKTCVYMVAVLMIGGLALVGIAKLFR